jgi:hypothetical protein
MEQWTDCRKVLRCGIFFGGGGEYLDQVQVSLSFISLSKAREAEETVDNLKNNKSEGFLSDV